MADMRPTTTSRRRIAALATAASLALLGALATVEPASAHRDEPHPGKPRHGDCDRQAKVRVPGAAVQKVVCLGDLTTAGTVASGHTNAAARPASGASTPTTSSSVTGC